MEKRKVSILGISRLLPSTPGAYLGCLRGLLELGMVLSMGEGGPKQALVDLGRLSNQVLHGFPLGPGLFGQRLKRRTVAFGLVSQRLGRGLDQALGELEGPLLKGEGVLYGRPQGFLRGIKTSWISLSCLSRSIILSSPLLFRWKTQSSN